MAGWVPKYGETLLIPSGPRENQMHLHIVLNDPKPFPDYGQHPSCALACLCSVPITGIPFDDNRVFAAGCHPFIVKDTYVSYRHFQVVSENHLIQCVTEGTYVVQAPMPAQYVASMIVGYGVSRRIPNYLKGLPL